MNGLSQVRVNLVAEAGSPQLKLGEFYPHNALGFIGGFLGVNWRSLGVVDNR
ncbi:MAG: hypothetical protein ACFFGZ_19525 [Candidatus Thorarchaeota archaeon]